MPARKVLIIDAPIFVMVDAETNPEEVASDFNDGFEGSLSGFNGITFDYDPEILDAAVHEIRIATKEEIDAVGIELEGDE